MTQKQNSLDTYVASNTALEKYALNVISGLQVFTADDLHVLETEIAAHNRDKRVIGAILKQLQAHGHISPVGYVKSQRTECHGRPIIQWKVTP